MSRTHHNTKSFDTPRKTQPYRRIRINEVLSEEA